MNSYINKRSAKLLLGWCIERYGPSQHADLKTLTIIIDPALDSFGEYRPYENIIVINDKWHRSLVSFCSTIIHEYTHFTQDMYKYAEYRNSYENHPYESTANNRGERDKYEARRWLLSKLRKKK
jgi:hypothetical protein